MKKVLFFFILLLFCLIKANKTPEVPVIVLEGHGYERGWQHGTKMKKEIQEVYSKWKENIGKDTGKQADEVIQSFLSSSNYKEAAIKLTPDIYEEVKGMAAGSGQSLDDVFAFQLIDEYWGYLDRLKNNSVDKEHCSAIGIAKKGNQPTIVAQNIDIDNHLNGYQLLMHIKGNEKTPDQLIMTSVGYIGFAGMNKNLALVINALTDLRNSVSGLPVTFVTRGLLERTNEKDALHFLNSISHATGQNYLLGTQNNVFSFEVSANQIDEYKPYDTNKLVYHTNHSLVNKDLKPWVKEHLDKLPIKTIMKSNSRTRLQSLSNQVLKSNQMISGKSIKSILQSKEDTLFPICVAYREGGSAFTFSSVIFHLGKQPFAEVTYGAPDQSEYQKHFLLKK